MSVARNVGAAHATGEIIAYTDSDCVVDPDWLHYLVATFLQTGLPAVCEAAYHAMDRGANYGVVEFIIRPKNTMKGFGFGTSGGGSVVPSVATATSPYGLAASLGFGLGWSSQRVEGEVMIQVTGLRVPTQTAAVKPTAPTAPQVPVTPAAPSPPPPACRDAGSRNR